MVVTTLRDQLVRDEGLRLKPYRDSVGKLTIGVGRNLDDVGITDEEAFFLLRNDGIRAEKAVTENLPWAASLESVRRAVLVNMAFNMGITRLLGFTKMLTALKAGGYNEAAREMLDSEWAKQVPERAARLARQMRFGGWE